MDFSHVVRVIERKTGIKLSGNRLSRIRNLYETKKDIFVDLEFKGIEDPSWQMVISAISVQETYFYRDGDVFECIKEKILPELLLKEPFGVNIWSAGCATGEEAYTLAMITFEVFRSMGKDPRGKVSVLGTDISKHAIEVAEKGFYRDIPMGPYRGFPKELMKYFEIKEKGYRIRDEVREIVKFKLHNLMDANLPITDANLVLCRNVLIYFTEEAKERVYDNLVRSLKRGGRLIMGPLDNPGRGLERHLCKRVLYFVKP